MVEKLKNDYIIHRIFIFIYIARTNWEGIKYIAAEIIKHIRNSQFKVNLYHITTSDNKEVNFVLENKITI
jgi:hypothetical protein